MATSKNIQSINEVVESQQAYMTVLYGHINTLYTKLAQLDKQIQIHCIYPHPQSDVIQLNAPDYNPNIDGDPDLHNPISCNCAIIHVVHMLCFTV